MKIKYSPQKANHDTVINIVDDNTIIIDDIEYNFDTASVAWPNIAMQTNHAILSAYRDETGELFIEVLRQYTNTTADWDTGDYHDFNR